MFAAVRMPPLEVESSRGGLALPTEGETRGERRLEEQVTMWHYLAGLAGDLTSILETEIGGVALAETETDSQVAHEALTRSESGAVTGAAVVAAEESETGDTEGAGEVCLPPAQEVAFLHRGLTAEAAAALAPVPGPGPAPLLGAVYLPRGPGLAAVAEGARTLRPGPGPGLPGLLRGATGGAGGSDDADLGEITRAMCADSKHALQ